MKKYAPVLLGIIIATVVMNLTPVKNLMGSMWGYGSCPNCGNSWYWNDSGSITCSSLEEGKDFTVTGDISKVVFVGMSSGVMICEKCLSRPGSLDSKRIGGALKKYEWEPEKVEQVVHAIERFKKEKRH